MDSNKSLKKKNILAKDDAEIEINKIQAANDITLDRVIN